jgi:hypothetical protein
MPRLNTKLESEGAEFLVLGHLLLEGIPAFKSYTNFPGYDLIATNALNNTSAKIQVKSRFKTDWGGFIIKNVDCDFVVLVTLNRGYTKPRRNGDTGVRPPDFYIFPIDYVLQVRDPNNAWDKIKKGRMVGFEQYMNEWILIKDFLQNVNKGNK